MEASVAYWEEPIDEDCDSCRYCDRCPCPGYSEIPSTLSCRHLRKTVGVALAGVRRA
ncbi:MAG TPA: hypothetical protein VL117_10545 [Thermoleophilia bacterium]|nr:hypothetical protein [Thermoleophilia bacterium]